MFSRCILAIVKRKKNKLGIKLGFDIPVNTIGPGLEIFHTGNIVINGKAKIGENCKIAGDCCVGDSGGEPRIGNNVTIAYGTIIIGNIDIADKTYIGAGSFVNKSIKEENMIVAGSPAKIIRSCS